jgi:hypothetical protein
MRQAEIVEQLTRIEGRLDQMVSADEIRQAMRDVLDTLSLVGQLREIESNQRDQLAMLVGLAAELLTEQRDDQGRARAGRDTIGDLLIQLRELGRKHVDALRDLERSVEAHIESDRK